MIWWTADLHLGHKAIIKMQNRPFADVEEMNETIIANYNARVGKNDKVYILGDITHHLTEEEARKIIKRLNGVKHLIIGNHDKITKVDGVTNIIEMRIYNETGNGYSPTQTAQYVIDGSNDVTTRKQIDLVSSQYMLNSEPDEMFEIKYPDKDIRIQVIQR